MDNQSEKMEMKSLLMSDEKFIRKMAEAPYYIQNGMLVVDEPSIKDEEGVMSS